MSSKPGPVVRGIRLGRSRISVLPMPRTAFLQTVCRSRVLRNLYHIKRKWPGQAGMAERSHPGRLAAEQAGDRSNMIADSDEVGGLARGVVGSARTIAFGTSIVAPSASAATVLVLVVAFAGYASPLVVLITFAGSLCCALSIGQFAGRLPSAGWAYTYNSRGLGPAA